MRTVCPPGDAALVDHLHEEQWASEHLDRQPAYLGHCVHERHRRTITNPRFDAMLKLFVDGRIEPVQYVARPYGKSPSW